MHPPRSREPGKNSRNITVKGNIFHSVRFQHAGYSRFIVSHREGGLVYSPPERDKGTGLRETAMEIDGRARWAVGRSGKKKRERGRNKTPINRSYRCNKRRYKNWVGRIGFSRNDDYHARYPGLFLPSSQPLTAFHAKNTEGERMNEDRSCDYE